MPGSTSLKLTRQHWSVLESHMTLYGLTDTTGGNGYINMLHRQFGNDHLFLGFHMWH